MSSHNYFPQELIDIIVGEHEDNIPTLQQCVLVSKSFLAPAQKLLFAFIDLGIDDEDAKSRRLYRRLCNITMVNPLILTYVRELRVTDNSSQLDPPDSPRLSWIRDEEDFPGFLTMLVNLERLVLQSDLYWASLPTTLRASLFNVFHKLDYLGLHGMQDIPRSICVAFKNVRGLSLWAITVDVEEEDDEDLMISPLAVQNARVEWLALQMLQESSPSTVLHVLITPGSTLPSLVALSLGPFDDDEVSDDWEVMKAVRETLESFSLDYDYRSWDRKSYFYSQCCINIFHRYFTVSPIILTPFDLADFKRLQHVSYHVTYSPDHLSTTPFAGLLGLLDTVYEENNIRWIFVRVDFPDSVAAIQQLNSYDGWNALDHLLRGTRFKNLELLHVDLALYVLGNGTQIEENIPIELRGLDHDPEHRDRLQELVCAKLPGIEGADMLSTSVQVVGF